jgi:two-component system cell cycle sensor histidine kinase/response regulator CckA
MDLSREELIGMHQSELHPKSTKKFNTETYSIHKNEVENNKPIIAVENKVIRRDGTEIAVEILASKVNYKGKKCLLGTFRDITIRKQSNIKIEESEKKYRQLFENMSQGAFYQSADGILIDVNKAALEMLGLSYDQFIGNTSSHPDWNVIGPDGKLLIPEKYASMLALRTGTAVTNLEMGVFRPKTLDYVWIIANAIPQFKPGETKPYQVFVTLHNITERKRIEDENFSKQYQNTLLLK